MKQRPIRVLAAAITVAALALTTQPAAALTVNPPKIASTYMVWLTRAMDQCDLGTSPGVVTIVGTGLPQYGCLQANSDTDSSLQFIVGRLMILRGKLVLILTGLTPGDQVRVNMTLRVTRGASIKPSGTAKVTFADAPAVCGPFTAGRGGSIAGVAQLASCLAPNNNLGASTGSNNIEILEASVSNAANGKPVAVGGIIAQ